MTSTGIRNEIRKLWDGVPLAEPSAVAATEPREACCYDEQAVRARLRNAERAETRAE